MKTFSFTEKEIAALTPADVASLAGRLEDDDYSNPFEALRVAI